MHMVACFTSPDTQAKNLNTGKKFKMESLKKKIVKYNNTKDYFSWETKKINVKSHKNCENRG